MSDTLIYLLGNLAEQDPNAPIYRYYAGQTPIEVCRKDFLEDVRRKRTQLLPYTGKTIAITAGNSYDYIVNCLGSVEAGCCAALLDSRWDAEETCGAVERIHASLLLYDEDSQDVFDSIRAKIPCMEGRLLTDSAGQAVPPAEEAFCEEGDLLIFTSGTSGKAKIAVTPIQSMLGHCRTIRQQASCKKGEWWAIPAPFFHSFGINMILLALVTETPLLISSMRYIEKDLKRSTVVGSFAVPYLVGYLLDHDACLTGVKKIITGGGKCSESMHSRCKEHGIALQNCYGSSELTACAALSRPDQPADRLYYHGEAHPFLNEEGELVLRTPFHMRGYFDMPDTTAEVLQPDGLHTGDAACLDAEGFFQIQGRISDVIVLESGEKVLVPEVEEILGSMPEVKEAVVLLAGNQLTAVFRTDAQDAAALMQQHVDAYNAKKPYALRIRDVRIYQGDFPRTSSGKLIRRALAAEFQKNS